MNPNESPPLNLLREFQAIPLHPAITLLPEETATCVVSVLALEQALDVMHIDLRGRASIADHLVIASGRTGRQIAALADQLTRTLKEKGFAISVEGKNSSDWILLDAGDVIIHLFRPETRAFYGIERMWGERTPEPSAVLTA